jgi:small subunit ribosomal protein S20
MAHHKSAKKRIRQNEKRRLRNQASRSKINTLSKKVLKAENKEEATELLKEAISFIDKTVSKGMLHKNTAARKKSKLTRYVNSLED